MRHVLGFGLFMLLVGVLAAVSPGCSEDHCHECPGPANAGTGIG